MSRPVRVTSPVRALRPPSVGIPDAALDADIAILGKKGRGKTYAARELVERLLDMRRRVLVLDPLSSWWGLRIAADGKREGYPVVVFGGPHADIAIDDKSGPALAGALVKDPIPAVVDLRLMRKAEQARLVADLLEELFARNREPMTIVLEEADAFAPQQPMNDMIRVLAEVDRIARRGRAFGFRLISITQRPAKLHKDVLTQLSTLVALGMTGPHDRNAIKSWVDGNADRDRAREVYDSLASLPVGEGWVWAPDLDMLEQVTFPPLKTLDTSAAPKEGATRFSPRALAQVDLDRLRVLLAPSPDANDDANGSGLEPPKRPMCARPTDGAAAARPYRQKRHAPSRPSLSSLATDPDAVTGNGRDTSNPVDEIVRQAAELVARWAPLAVTLRMIEAAAQPIEKPADFPPSAVTRAT